MGLYKKQTHSLKSLFDLNPYVHSFGTNQSILRDSIIFQQLKVTDTHDWFFYMRNASVLNPRDTRCQAARQRRQSRRRAVDGDGGAQRREGAEKCVRGRGTE